MDDLERYKADMARARDAGITFASIRDIMSAHADDGPDGESFGRMVERIRELALQAAAEMASEERAAVVAFLRETLATSETAHASDDLDYAIAIIERGEHRRGEET